jgi:hypothetical protein
MMEQGLPARGRDGTVRSWPFYGTAGRISEGLGLYGV